MSSSILFTITDDQIILRSAKGVYRQAKIATRKGLIYACHGGGFVLLYANGVTSVPTLRREDMDTNIRWDIGKLGRLIIVGVTNAAD